MVKTRVAVIGAGFFAEKHLEVVSTFDDVELVGISGRGNARIHPLADRFEIKDRFSNYDCVKDLAQRCQSRVPHTVSAGAAGTT